MEPLTEHALLTAWESSTMLTPTRRAVVLLSIWTGLPVDTIDALALGARDRMLLDLREQSFGSTVECLATCQACAEELEVEVMLDELRSPEPVMERLEIDVAGHALHLRPLTSADLEASDGTRADLVERCILDGDRSTPNVADAVEAAIDTMDPQAAMHVELDCPCCGTKWYEPFDVASFVCDEMACCAQRLLGEVHTLATAYGWCEHEVLAVSPARRRYYLEACVR